MSYLRTRVVQELCVVPSIPSLLNLYTQLRYRLLQAVHILIQLLAMAAGIRDLVPHGWTLNSLCLNDAFRPSVRDHRGVHSPHERGMNCYSRRYDQR